MHILKIIIIIINSVVWAIRNAKKCLLDRVVSYILSLKVGKILHMYIHILLLILEVA